MMKSRMRIGKGMQEKRPPISVVKYVAISFIIREMLILGALVALADIVSLPVIQSHPTFIIPTAPSLIHHRTVTIPYPHLPPAHATKSPKSFVHD